MGVSKDTIRKATGSVNALMYCLGCTNYHIYHVYRFHNYRNCPNKMEPDIAERAKR